MRSRSFRANSRLWSRWAPYFLASPGRKRLGNRGRVKPTNTWTAIWLQNLYHFHNSSQACLFWEPQFVAWKCQQWCGGMLRPFASICCGKVMGSSVLLQVMLLQVTVAMKAGEWRYERMLGYDRLRLLQNISGCVSSAESVPWPNQCHDQTSVRAVYKHVHVCVWHTCAAPRKAPQLEPWWPRFVRLHCWDLWDRCGKMLLCTSWIPSVHEGAAGTEALPPRPPPCKPAKDEVQMVYRSITYILKTHIMTCSISAISVYGNNIDELIQRTS